MEQLGHPIILDAAAVIDAIASIPTRPIELKASHSVFIGYSRKHHLAAATAVEEYRNSLAVRLRELVERENGPSQRHFWNFFDEVTVPRQRYVIAHEFCHKNLDRSRHNFASRPPTVVCDGQHRLIAYNSPNRDLSVRAIRSVLLTAIEELAGIDEPKTVFEVLDVLDSSLTQEVTKHIRWKDHAGKFDLETTAAPSTREWVLGFFFRTGNPPPRSGNSCPAERWAIVTITDARRDDYATIQGQEVSRNLRNTICEQRARTRFDWGTQNYANNGGSSKPARYRPPLPHHSLAQCA